VQADDVVVVLGAKKMEQPLAAHKDGTISGLSVTIGQTVTVGAPSARSSESHDRGQFRALLPQTGHDHETC
jgi:acetyl-CoA/propionyl-CoA carboxylase biotin carboxyl carrier protein